MKYSTIHSRNLQTMQKTEILKDRIINQLISLGIVKFNFTQPITFKSGIVSPIYFNFREALGNPGLMETICAAFALQIIECNNKNLKNVVIVGVQTGGSPHASRVASRLRLPEAYVRQQLKDHGLKRRIEGAPIAEGTVVELIEDLSTTAGSMLETAKVLTEAGATVRLNAIFSYGLQEEADNLSEAGLRLNSLITMSDIMPQLEECLSTSDYHSLVDWVRNPREWFHL